MNRLSRLHGRARLVTVDLVGLPRFRMETHGRSDVFVSRAIEDWGNWDISGTAIVLQLLRSVADFVDVGANIGWYTLVAAHALAGRGHVHSFEPDPAHLTKLRTNVAVNRLGNVTVNDWALSDRTGTARLFLNDVNRGDNSLLPSATRTRSATVNVARLDDYSALSSERPLVIKIDVQGTELDVLTGARRLLETHPHEVLLLCELSPTALAAGGRTAHQIAAFLDILGFAAALIDRVHAGIIPMSWDRVVERQLAEHASKPGEDVDIIVYRRIDGLLAPIFRRAEIR
jgi:FkbM family methyltransferase